MPKDWNGKSLLLLILILILLGFLYLAALEFGWI